MDRICYRLRPGIDIQREPDGRWRLQGEGIPTVRLSAGAMKPLELVDGQRSEEEIEELLVRRAVPIPPGAVKAIFGSLARAGVLELHSTAWKPLEAAVWPAHRCQQCGACCQGRPSGQLDDDFLQTTYARLPELIDRYPRLAEVQPFVQQSREDRWLTLNFESGQCVFLDEDLKCILHKEYGPEAKPSSCQMFPHVRIETESQTRLAVGLTCLRQYDQVLGGEPAAPAAHWESIQDRIDGRFFHTRRDEERSELEASLLAQLRQPEREDALTLALEALGVGAAQESVPRSLQLDILFRRHLMRLEDVLEKEPDLDRVEQLNGVYPERLRQLRKLARAARAGGVFWRRASSSLSHPASPLVRLIDDGVTRLLFLRDYLQYHSLEHALAVFALGVWSGLVLTDDGRELGEMLATWIRLVEAPGARRDLFRHPGEVDLFLHQFHSFWSEVRSRPDPPRLRVV